MLIYKYVNNLNSTLSQWLDGEKGVGGTQKVQPPPRGEFWDD